MSVVFPWSLSLLTHDILEARGQGSDLGVWFTRVDVQIAGMQTLGQHIDPSPENSPPAGYSMQPKVECALRNIIMMFVTANDSAWVENKRGASGFVANGAEEWRREVVAVVEWREAGPD